MKKRSRLVLMSLAILFNATILSAQQSAVTVLSDESTLILDNGQATFEFDYFTGTYSLTDAVSGLVVLADARLSPEGWNLPGNQGPGMLKPSGQRAEITDVEGGGRKGKKVVLTFSSDRKQLPEYLFSVTLYEGTPALVFQSGIRNTLPFSCRFTRSDFTAGSRLYPETELAGVQTLNGAAGVTAPWVAGDTTRSSYNSMLLTALAGNRRVSVVWGGLRYAFFYAETSYNRERKSISLTMTDPVGRLISPGETWWAPDTYYLSAGEPNPFTALEAYGMAMREANNAHPNVYDFPTLCGWAVGNLSGGKDINNSNALIEQLDNANRCGLTRYTKVAVRLEPDTYCYTDGNTEQGWWDDEHWSRYGHLVPPYETFAKWCAAVRERNGIPFTYFQSGMPSDDFARAHPEWMLDNDISRLNLYHRHHQPYVRYDYTDPEFRQYVLVMWKRLRSDGMIGIKFDYPETAWNPQGGYEDSLATTTSSYRTMFELCREGLGPDARIHERALGESGRPTLDVTAGIVDIQRTAWDNNAYEAQFVTTDGLRWYKARSVFLYYPDSKAIHPHDSETRQSLVTMIALTSGRLELATPFDMLTPEMVHDISRIYPMYHGTRSPRPLDAFTGMHDPCIYDLELTPEWHQVTLFNSSSTVRKVSTVLGGEMTDGNVQLEAGAEYHVYDFWNDSYAGKVSYGTSIERTLNPLACVMLSVRKVEGNPQLISTNRHILQGWMDTRDVTWNGGSSSLSGKSSVIGGEPYVMVIALNGYKTVSQSADQGIISVEKFPEQGIARITITSPKTAEINWRLNFRKLN